MTTDVRADDLGDIVGDLGVEEEDDTPEQQRQEGGGEAVEDDAHLDLRGLMGRLEVALEEEEKVGRALEKLAAKTWAEEAGSTKELRQICFFFCK